MSGHGGLQADRQLAGLRQWLEAQGGDHARRAGDVRRAASAPRGFYPEALERGLRTERAVRSGGCCITTYTDHLGNVGLLSKTDGSILSGFNAR